MRKHIPSGACGAIALFLMALPKYPPVDFWDYFALIGAVAFLALTIYIWSKEQHPTLDMQKITVILAHANLFNYCGATQDDMYRPLNRNYPIQIEATQAKGSNEFVFGIDIGEENIGIPLEKARLTINFKREDRLKVEPQKAPDGISDHEWRCHDTNVEYWYRFSEPIIAKNINTWTCLYITFPKPGTYVFELKIEGIGIHTPIKQSVEVVVHNSL